MEYKVLHDLILEYFFSININIINVGTVYCPNKPPKLST